MLLCSTFYFTNVSNWDMYLFVLFLNVKTYVMSSQLRRGLLFFVMFKIISSSWHLLPPLLIVSSSLSVWTRPEFPSSYFSLSVCLSRIKTCLIVVGPTIKLQYRILWCSYFRYLTLLCSYYLNTWNEVTYLSLINTYRSIFISVSEISLRSNICLS